MALAQRCQACGYDMSAAAQDRGPMTCPECGAEFWPGDHAVAAWPGYGSIVAQMCLPFGLMAATFVVAGALLGRSVLLLQACMVGLPLVGLAFAHPVVVARQHGLKFPPPERPWLSRGRIVRLGIFINAAVAGVGFLLRHALETLP